MKDSRINLVVRLQRWMDSVPGQTFLNYAYSWGAAVVILGTLFKLTHLPGANLMLFLGMGTEVRKKTKKKYPKNLLKSTIPKKPLMASISLSLAVAASLVAVSSWAVAAWPEEAKLQP